MARSYTRRIQLWINGKEVQASIKNVRDEMRRLVNEQNLMTVGSKEYIEHGKKISHLQGILTQHRASIQATSGAWSGILRWITRYRQMLLLTLASMAGGGLSIRKAVQDFNELEESISALEAITGLAGKNMDWLADQAKQMSTSIDENGVRITQSAKDIVDAFALIGSQRPELLQNKEALAEVTQAALTLAAAGKIDLEQAARAVTGAMNQMDLGADQALRVINALGAGSQAGAANIAYLNQVIERTGTTAKNIGIPFEQLVGTIEAIAPKFTSAEEASTQLRNVLLRLASGIAETDPAVVGLDMALENLADQQLSLAELNTRFGRANVNMAATLIENRKEVQRYTQVVTGSNVAIEQAIINTSTNAAKLQQARNELQLISIALGERLSPAITGGIRGLAEFLKFTQATIETVWKFRGVIITTAASIAGYTLAVKGKTMAMAAYATILKIVNGLQSGFNVLITKNPVGLVVAGFTALVVGVQQYSAFLRRAASDVQRLSYEEKTRADLLAQTQKRTADELASLDLLIERIKNANTSNDERKNLIGQLNREYNPYLNNLVSEQATLQQIQAAYDQIVTSLRQRIEIQVKEEKAKQLFADLYELRAKLAEHGPDIKEVMPGLFEHLNNQIEETEAMYHQLIAEITQAPASAKLPDADPEGDGTGAAGWSLAKDQDFIRQSLELKQRFHDGLIKSEQEYQKLHLDLEIQFLEARLGMQVDSAEDLLNLQHQLADKRLQAHRAEQQRLQALQNEVESPAEKEKREYDERLVALGLFGRDYRNMSALEQAAFKATTQAHQDRMAAITSDQLKQHIDQRQHAHETALANMKLFHAQELESFEGTAEERRRLIDRHQKTERDLIANHLKETLSQLQEVMESGSLGEMDLADLLLSEETRTKLQELINKVKTDLAGLIPGTGKEDSGELRGVYMDIFGFTQDDWNQLFANIDRGKVGIEEMQMAVLALSNLWYDVSRMVSLQEEKKLAEFERSNEQQKEMLQQRLNAGLISHEYFIKHQQRLEEDLDKQRATTARNQARRERNVALMQAIVNTAAGITKALASANVALAAIIGVAGALQIGIIASTPLPQIPGAETGGHINIVRSQDQKKFRGRYQPGKRGWITQPTVITGESGYEYVIPDEGVRNPKLRPIINMIEMARVNGNLPTLDPDVPGLFERSLPGRQRGGQLSQQHTDYAKLDQTPTTNPDLVNKMMAIIDKNTKIMDQLNKRLQDPITAEVALLGNKGFYEKEREFKQTQKNAYS